MTMRPGSIEEALNRPLSSYAGTAVKNHTDGCWIEIKCCRPCATYYPVRLMLTRHSDRPLRKAIDVFRCKHCGARPSAAWLCQTHNREPCHGAAPGWSIQLVGEDATSPQPG